MREMVGGCCVCSDDRGWSENPLVYCDGQSCTVAVHQACYGIVTVPTGPWYCRKCESQERAVKVKCELCPSKYGALKRTDNSGWAHVVCALYIPEVRFGNVTTMEPIQLQLIPAERFNKVCYICQDKGKASNANVGACMQCNKPGCRMQFHVTCAQSLGLLCEEAGNYLDNVKYCGYCQHHYSKLKKGGNVKPIPPYKPVSSTENQLSDSNSEKEAESAGGNTAAKTSSSSTTQLTSSTSSSSSSSKRKTSSSGKTSSKTNSSAKASSSTSSATSSSSSSHQKTVHNSNSTSNSSSSSKNTDKLKTSSSSARNSGSTSASVKSIGEDNNSAVNIDSSTAENSKTIESGNRDLKSEEIQVKSESKSSKKRKTNSRTPTPVALIPTDSVISSGSSVTTSQASVVAENLTAHIIGDKKLSANELKKAKIDITQTILSNQPVVALTAISTIKSISTTQSTISESNNSATPPPPVLQPQQTIIHSNSGGQTQHPNSLVVSVPLTSTSLSPHHQQVFNNQTSVVQTAPLLDSNKNKAGLGANERNTPNSHLQQSTSAMTGGNSNPSSTTIISSEMSGGGGLKIAYEKQDAVTTEVDMELEVVPTTNQEVITKRSSLDSKIEKTTSVGRGKKRSSNNGMMTQLNNNASIASGSSSSVGPSATVVSGLKRGSGGRSQNASPQQHAPGAFASITQAQLKDSPPSSPSSESQHGVPSHSGSGRGRTKSRKSAPAAMARTSSPKEKDIKLFQNGVATAPHMLGNQLNPTSNMAQKMTDHLNSELEAHSIFNPNDNSNLVGPQLHHRVIASARASSTGGSSTASGGSGLSSMLGGSGGNIPQTLDQLLERQWEQGSQFLMEQAQHFDIASLLSCLHQLRAENLRLEEHVSSLLQRRDHLLAVNARLAIPLTGQPATPQSSHSHAVNNIHPAVGASHVDVPRSAARHSVSSSSSSGGSSNYPAHPQGGQHPVGVGIVENGLPPSAAVTDQAYFAQQQQQQHSHRSSTTNQSQPSPSIRHSPAGTAGYPSSNLLNRQTADTSGRSAPRPQPYPLYQGQGPSSQQQMVIRRDIDNMHHQSSSSKPS